MESFTVKFSTRVYITDEFLRFLLCSNDFISFYQIYFCLHRFFLSFSEKEKKKIANKREKMVLILYGYGYGYGGKKDETTDKTRRLCCFVTVCQCDVLVKWRKNPHSIFRFCPVDLQ